MRYKIYNLILKLDKMIWNHSIDWYERYTWWLKLQIDKTLSWSIHGDRYYVSTKCTSFILLTLQLINKMHIWYEEALTYLYIYNLFDTWPFGFANILVLAFNCLSYQWLFFVLSFIIFVKDLSTRHQNP